MAVRVEEVVTHRDLRRFVDFPYKLYAGHPCWVPPLKMSEQHTLRRDKNPAFEFCEARYWLAYDGRQPVGRIACIINGRFEKIWGKRYARFGWLDFEDDPAVTDALFDAAEAWARSKAMTACHGPLGFTDLDREGMLVEGFAELATAATLYNYDYYPAHMERLGYRKDVDWVEFELRRPPAIPDKMGKIARRVAERHGLRVLPAHSPKDLLPYARDMFAVMNAAYRDLYGFVPLTERQMDAYIQENLSYVRADCVCLVVDRDDRVAAFAISMPSLAHALQRCRGRLLPFGFLHLLKARRANDTVDFCLVAARPDWQGRGVHAIVMHELGNIYLDCGFSRGETNPELETNKEVQAMWKMFDSRQHKRRRCFIKEL